MIIQLDVDGVLSDFTGGCLAVMRGMGFHFTHDDVTEWEIDHLLHEEQRAEFWRRVDLPGFCLGLQALPTAHAAVRTLRDAGHDVRFLTSPSKTSLWWREERLRWLDHNVGGGHQSYAELVTFAHDKAAHPGDWLVDDKPEHVQAWLATGRRAVLVDHPYNRGRGPSVGLRARDALHAAELILGMDR